MHLENEVGTVDENEKRNSIEKRLAYKGPYQVEVAQYLNANRSYNFKPNLNLLTITHQHLETMRISHMGEEHSKFKDLGRIFNNIMLYLGSNNNKEVKEQKIMDKGDILPLKNIC